MKNKRAVLNQRAGLLLMVTCCLTVCQAGLQAADWPTYRADAQRSGFTTDGLAEELALQWRLRNTHAIQSAWPRSTRLT